MLRKTPRANILIITMFILFISSLLGLLVVKYVQNMISYSSEFHDYFKAYYMSYGGLELSLTKINNHGFGYEDVVAKDSLTSKNNYKYCHSGKCYFSANIKNLTNFIVTNNKSYLVNSCESNYIQLKNGQGIIVPLFYDQNNGEGTLSGINYQKFSESDFRNMVLKMTQSSNKFFTIGVADIDNTSRSIIEKKLTVDPIEFPFNTYEFNNFYNSSLQSFLVIGNTESADSIENVCLNSPNVKIPAPYMVVESVGNYFDRVVSLQAIKLKAIPDYLIYNIIGN